MQAADEAAFNGPAIDRHANLRADPAKIKACRADKTARTMVVWRGRMLWVPNSGKLLWVLGGHPGLPAEPSDAVFLGIDQQGPVFASDVSSLSPEQAAEMFGAVVDSDPQSKPSSQPAFADLRQIMVLLTAEDATHAATARALFSWHNKHQFCANCGARSVPTMAGWQRQCLACETHSFPTTNPVVIMLVLRGNNVLLGRSPGWPPTVFSLLAGFVEPGETIESAVRREVAEESSVLIGEVGYLASQPWPFPASLMIGCKAVALSSDIKIDPVEIEEARWVSREMMARCFAGSTPDLSPPRPGSIARFLLGAWLKDSFS